MAGALGLGVQEPDAGRSVWGSRRVNHAQLEGPALQPPVKLDPGRDSACKGDLLAMTQGGLLESLIEPEVLLVLVDAGEALVPRLHAAGWASSRVELPCRRRLAIAAAVSAPPTSTP